MLPIAGVLPLLSFCMYEITSFTPTELLPGILIVFVGDGYLALNFAQVEEDRPSYLKENKPPS